ncbi:MAG: hypothetical protein M1823_002960 [Watsoniomyces obsoletus]|nr:MAG: hypothetical protein M1823_002960 [Watsoniomyces obsoletus]
MPRRKNVLSERKETSAVLIMGIARGDNVMREDVMKGVRDMEGIEGAKSRRMNLQIESTDIAGRRAIDSEMEEEPEVDPDPDIAIVAIVTVMVIIIIIGIVKTGTIIESVPRTGMKTDTIVDDSDPTYGQILL